MSPHCHSTFIAGQEKKISYNQEPNLRATTLSELAEAVVLFKTNEAETSTIRPSFSLFLIAFHSSVREHKSSYSIIYRINTMKGVVLSAGEEVHFC